MVTDALELFKRNGLISADGRMAGVLSPPRADRLLALQAELNPLIKEAQRRKVLLRLGIRQPEFFPDEVLIYALDVGGPHDTHGFIRRLAAILERYGAQPLDCDLGSSQVFELAHDLVASSQPL